MAAGGEVERAGLHTFFGDGLKLAFAGTYVHKNGQTYSKLQTTSDEDDFEIPIESAN